MDLLAFYCALVLAAAVLMSPVGITIWIVHVRRKAQREALLRNIKRYGTAEVIVFQ